LLPISSPRRIVKTAIGSDQGVLTGIERIGRNVLMNAEDDPPSVKECLRQGPMDQSKVAANDVIWKSGQQAMRVDRVCAESTLVQELTNIPAGALKVPLVNARLIEPMLVGWFVAQRASPSPVERAF
jgi:hypothetical protein